ncbi:group I truncated hemoglobin [Paludifilum halophilum]|uniref:group I truncated hemoglobin n=1 Tax=Paludifilum halophilum TaxID=1642702 RepID=UPI00146B3152|nr:group 1 truncated hemoglobin [Paludifilum halophilum]
MGYKSLYDELGGEKAITAVVNEFYDRMIDDDRVRHYFVHTNTDRLRKHQISFFVSHLLGGPKEYKGSTLRMAHQGLNITFDAYEIAIKHLNRSLIKYNVPLDIRVKVEAFLRTMKPHIINK